MYSTVNTRFAAALITLGYQRLPDGNGTFSIEFRFEDAQGLVLLEQTWNRDSDQGEQPIELMRQVSKARDWVVTRVVHGNHNEGKDPPPEAYQTRSLHFACCLVAQQFYLIKLDKLERVFYFDARAESLWDKYCSPEGGSAMDWQIKYLNAFDKLIRSTPRANLILDKRSPMRNNADNLKRDTIKRELAR